MNYRDSLGNYGLDPEQFGPREARQELEAVHHQIMMAFDDILKMSIKSTTALMPESFAGQAETVMGFLLKFLSLELPNADVSCWKFPDWQSAVDDLERKSQGWRLSPEDLPQRIQYWAWDRDGILDEDTIQAVNLPKNSIDAGMIHVPSHHFFAPLADVLGMSANADLRRRMFTPGVISIRLSRRTQADYTECVAAFDGGDNEILKDFLTVFTMFQPRVVGDPVFPTAAKYVAGSRYLKTHGGR